MINDLNKLLATGPVDAISMTGGSICLILFGLAAYDYVKAFRHFFPMINHMANPRFAWLGGVLLFSDRFFSKEGAFHRRRFLVHFLRGFVAVSATLVVMVGTRLLQSALG
jgi:hypothetical protein